MKSHDKSRLFSLEKRRLEIVSKTLLQKNSKDKDYQNIPSEKTKSFSKSQGQELKSSKLINLESQSNKKTVL